MAEAIAPISGLSAMGSGAIPQPAVKQSSEKALRAASKLFNTSVEELQRSLQSGSSLQDIAHEKGVNRGQLVNAIREAFQSEGNHLDYQTSTQIAKHIVARKGSQQHNQQHQHAE